MPKHPPHLYTITISFGPSIPVFQQHFSDGDRAKRYMRLLRERMICGTNHKTGDQCIERLELWNRNTMLQVATPITLVPKSTWLPAPDADGVVRIPERGVRPKRDPSKLVL